VIVAQAVPLTGAYWQTPSTHVPGMHGPRSSQPAGEQVASVVLVVVVLGAMVVLVGQLRVVSRRRATGRASRP
jgi:hypothetical protein